MSSTKTNVNAVIETEQKEWLEQMADKHGLEDASKVMRVVLDYAIEDGSEGEIFEEERCRFC